MHLNETELIDHLEGRLPAVRAAHVASCERCRREAEGLAATLGVARAADVPEPTSLVLDHFRARVNDAIAAEDAVAAGTPWFRWPRFAVATAAIAAVAIVGLSFALWRRDGPPPSERTSARQEPPAASIEPLPDADPEWSFVASMADEMDWEDVQAAGLVIPPGAAERAAVQLTEAEQTELARLLREEMGGTEGPL